MATARGAVIVMLGNIAALIISAIGVLLLAKLLSPAEYGRYTIALLPAHFCVLFIDWGINAALPRFLVQHRIVQAQDSQRVLVWAGLIVKWLISLILFAALVVLAEPIATQVLNRPDAQLLIQVSALVVVGETLFQTILAVFAGFEQMAYRSILMIVQAAIKAVVALILVLLGLGVVGAIGGYVTSVLVAAVLGVGLIWKITGAPYPLQQLPSLWLPATKMIRFGFPLFVSGLVAMFGVQIRLILLPWFVSDAVIGNFQVAQNFTMLIISVTSAIGVALYPMFSKFSFTQNPEGTRHAYRSAVRYSTLLVIPVTLLLITIAEPMITTLYAKQYPQAPSFFTLLAIPGLLSGFGFYVFLEWLNSQGDTRRVLVFNILQSVISIVLSPVGLVMGGMTGFIVSLLLSHGVATIYAVLTLNRHYGIAPVFPHTFRVLCVAGVASIATVSVLWILSDVAPIIQLFGGSILYSVLLLILAPGMGAITSSDVDALSAIFKKQWGIGYIVRFILYWEAKILRRMHR
jgi:O-antigen/teichoic acid export membrane protein